MTNKIIIKLPPLSRFLNSQRNSSGFCPCEANYDCIETLFTPLWVWLWRWQSLQLPAQFSARQTHTDKKTQPDTHGHFPSWLIWFIHLFCKRPWHFSSLKPSLSRTSFWLEFAIRKMHSAKTNSNWITNSSKTAHSLNYYCLFREIISMICWYEIKQKLSIETTYRLLSFTPTAVLHITLRSR